MTLELSLSTSELAEVELRVRVPPAMVSGPAKLVMALGAREAPLATPPTATVAPVVLARVTPVALLMELIYQPCEAGSALLTTAWPGTRFAVLATASVGAVVVPALAPVVVKAAVAP